jgi:phosphoglycolate phosphatase-like HAD superfamily hydrolase
MTTERLVAIVGRTRNILLDFDGPISSIFANHPAPVVAAELRGLLVGHGVALPETMRDEADPIEILRYTATLDRPWLTTAIDDALRAAELTAARTAEPAPYAHDVIVTAHRTGRRVAVVSNNSAESINAYLSTHGLTNLVHPVIGRAYAEPSLMKPNPAPLRQAMATLRGAPGTSLLVGDSVSDVDASRAAQIAAVGYANKPGKKQRLAHADVVITSMGELVAALLAP